MASGVAEDWWKVYTKEWKEARHSLSKEKHDEEVIYLLMRIVRGVSDFCLDETKKGHHKKKKHQDLTKEFIQHRLPLAIHKDNMDPSLKAFIHRCVECLIKMCSLHPAPYIYWIPKGDMIDQEKFEIDGNKLGHVCDWTVWPAMIAESGDVLKKGVVLPV